MEREFESEIGARISEGSRRRSSNRIGVLTAAAISCALLLGSAAFLLPAMSSAGEGKVVSVEFYSGDMDYLVLDVDSGCLIHNDAPYNGEYAVKKSTNLKAMVYPPSDNALGKYVKFVYTATVHLVSVGNLIFAEDVTVADLSIPYDSSDTLTGGVVISWTVTVGDVSWDINDVILDADGTPADGVTVPTPASSSYDGTLKALGAQIVLPVLEDGAYVNTGTDTEPVLTKLPAQYGLGDIVQVQVSIKVASPIVPEEVTIPAYLWSLVPTEDAFPAFPDSDDLPVAAIVATPTSVSMGDTVKLDASSSSADVVSYEWYLVISETTATQIGAAVTCDYTFVTIIGDEVKDDPPGDYTFRLIVTDDEILKDVAEVVVSVYDDENPEAAISISDEVTNLDGSVTVTFDGSGSTDNVGVVSYVWLIVTPLGCKDWGFEVSITYDFAVDAGVYTVTLTVFDAAGNADTETISYPS